MNHVIVYEGKGVVALGLMQEMYIPLMVPWINRRTDIEGTLLRPPYAPEHGIEWVRKMHKEKGVHEVFAVLVRKSEKKSYEYAGHMGIHGVEWPNGVAGTGSVIGTKKFQGRGIGTEAKLLLLYHAFCVLGLRKLASNVKAFNLQSAGHLLKCGYQPAGRFRKHHFHNGAFVDIVLFEVFREDWEPIWKRYQETATLPTLTEKQRAFLQNGMMV